MSAAAPNLEAAAPARPRVAPRWWWALGLFFSATLVGSSMFASAFGLTYDEPVYAAVGARHVDWLGHALRFDRTAWSFEALEDGWGNSGPVPALADWHPAVGKVWQELWRRIAPSWFGPFGGYRLGSTLLWAATGAVLLLWLAEAAGLLAGLAAALLFLAWPAAVLHGNLNGLDGPATFFATAAAWLAWRQMSAPSRRRTWAYGIVLGLGISTKFNAVLIAPAVLIAAAAWRRPALRGLAAGTFLIAPLLFVLLWPWLWYDGWTHLGQVIAFHGRHFPVDTEYFGQITGTPPWHYPFVMLAVTTPLATLALAIWGAVRPARVTNGSGQALRWFLLVALLCHILPFADPTASKYNTVRLFLPVLPIVAALAALGLASIRAGLQPRLATTADRRQLLAGGLLAAAVLPTIVDTLNVHPYPTAFYNRLVGGSAGAAARGLEVSYWGEPFAELLAELSRRAPEGATAYVCPPGAIAGLGVYRALGLWRRDIRLVSGADAAPTADYFVYQNRPSEWDELGFELRSQRQPVYTAFGGDAPVGFIWAAAGKEWAAP